MTKPVATMARKKSLRRHEEETLEGTRLKRKPILIWITPDHVITNNSLLQLCAI